MIVKISKGRSWAGAHQYIYKDGKASHLLGNLPFQNFSQASRIVGEFRKLRPNLKKAIAHYSLSLPPNEHLTDEQWRSVATEFILKMGHVDCPHVCFKHTDTNHAHIHILALRIDSRGGVVSDKNDFARAESVARALEQRMGLTTPHQEKEIYQRRPTMNNFSAQLPSTTKPSETRKQRRLRLEPNYLSLMSAILDGLLYEHHNWPDCAHFKFKPNGEMRDRGDRVETNGVSHELAARIMVQLALQRGWTGIQFSGSREFLEFAFVAALDAGLPISCVGDEQSALLKEIVARRQLSALDLNASSVKERLLKNRANQPTTQADNTNIHKPTI